MTDLSISTARQGNWVTPFFAGTMLASAALVFLVEPMIARMILPQLGGSPAVWNASVAFFQVALLTGYLYAHLLRDCRRSRLRSASISSFLLPRRVMPIGVASAFGAAPVGNPVVWLLAVLTVSIGAPFVMLSATAPLLRRLVCARCAAMPKINLCALRVGQSGQHARAHSLSSDCRASFDLACAIARL